MEILGVIGGLGPMATVYFLELVTGMTDVAFDQQHIPMIVKSIPDTPDRTAYILDHTKENPFPKLIEAGKQLKSQGAGYIAIPCITAHYFHSELERAIQLPILSLPDELGGFLRKQNVKKVGILATSGTVDSLFLQNCLERYGISVVLPSQPMQDCLMEIIYDQIKAGKRPQIGEFLKIGNVLKKAGAQRLILGCTELSLLKRDFSDMVTNEYVDALELLAEAAIRYNALPVKKYIRGNDYADECAGIY